MAASEPTKPRFWLMSHGVAKKNNIGQMMRSACAFGAEAFVFVGGGHISTHGAMGTQKHLRVARFAKLPEAVEHFHSMGATIVGVEIAPSARSVAEEPFTGDTVLMMGNEGHGLTEQQKAACDSFVYIPQFGSGTASLNVAAAAAIVMHRFASWAGYNERARDDEHADKFAVAKLPDPATAPRTEEELALRAARARKRAEAAAAAAQYKADAESGLAQAAEAEEDEGNGDDNQAGTSSSSSAAASSSSAAEDDASR